MLKRGSGNLEVNNEPLLNHPVHHKEDVAQLTSWVSISITLVSLDLIDYLRSHRSHHLIPTVFLLAEW